MYSPLRNMVQTIFKVSPHAPHVPPGGQPASGSERGGYVHAQVFRASLAYWRYRMLGYWLRVFFLAIPFLGGAAAAAFGLGSQGYIIPGAILGGFIALLDLAITVLMYVLVRLDYEFRWYVVTDRSLRIRQGIMKFEETTLTFANVQNVSVRQGPIERWFGFANVLVETAGGGGTPMQNEQAIASGGHRGLIRGLENAEEVKTLIRQAVVHRGGAGLGDRDDHKAPAPTVPNVPLAAAGPALREVLAEVKALRATLAQN